MPIITDIKGRIIFNSRGSKSIEVDITSDDKFLGRACAPSGAAFPTCLALLSIRQRGN